MRSEREREGHREKEIRRKKERQGIEDEGQERDREEETDMGKGRRCQESKSQTTNCPHSKISTAGMKNSHKSERFCKTCRCLVVRSLREREVLSCTRNDG